LIRQRFLEVKSYSGKLSNPAPEDFLFLLRYLSGVGSRLGDLKQPVTFGANVRPPPYVC